MERLILLLFLIASLPSTTAYLTVFTDKSNCVHLRCEWRGEGKHCKSGSRDHLFNRGFYTPEAGPVHYELHGDDEPQDSILERIQSLYPLNTFTLADEEIARFELCKRRHLWCNGVFSFVTKDYDALLKVIRTHAYPPKFRCQPAPFLPNDF